MGLETRARNDNDPGQPEQGGMPAAAPESKPAGEAQAVLAEDPAARHVLLVEDEALVAMATAQALQNLGWTVIGPATTLEEAQILVSSGVRLDAAVLDVNLQGRWAHAVAEQLAEREVPFIVCTGWEMVDPEGRFAGAPLIAKPVSPDRLGAALDDLIVSARAGVPKT